MDTEQLYNLAADDILDKLAAIESQIEDLTAQKTAYRDVLTTFYKDGTINVEDIKMIVINKSKKEKLYVGKK